MKSENEIVVPCIGIIDSGVGGFSVLGEIRKVTSANCLYYGDCARAPYGNRSQEEIVSFVKEMLMLLTSRGATHFVSACNSMSVLTTDTILKECHIDEDVYVDMIRAFKKHAIFPTGSCVIVAATQATITSGEYQNFLKLKGYKNFTYALPSLAKKIEDGVVGAHLRKDIMESLMFAKFFDATHFVFGCTHYPLVRDTFVACAKEIGWNGVFVDPAEHVAQEVAMWNIVGQKMLTCEASKETEVFLKMRQKYIHVP